MQLISQFVFVPSRFEQLSLYCIFLHNVLFRHYLANLPIVKIDIKINFLVYIILISRESVYHNVVTHLSKFNEIIFYR